MNRLAFRLVPLAALLAVACGTEHPVGVTGPDGGVDGPPPDMASPAERADPDRSMPDMTTTTPDMALPADRDDNRPPDMNTPPSDRAGTDLPPADRPPGTDLPPADRPPGTEVCDRCTADQICVQLNDSSTMCRSPLPTLVCVRVSAACKAMITNRGCSMASAACKRELCGGDVNSDARNPYQCEITPPCGNEVDRAELRCYGP